MPGSGYLRPRETERLPAPEKDCSGWEQVNTLIDKFDLGNDARVSMSLLGYVNDHLTRFSMLAQEEIIYLITPIYNFLYRNSSGQNQGRARVCYSLLSIRGKMSRLKIVQEVAAMKNANKAKP